MLDRAAACDPGGWFRTAASIGNQLRVCGLAATYTMLHAIGPVQGRLLNYKQAIDDRRTCCVSFASMAFHAARCSFDPGRGPCLELTADPLAAPTVPNAAPCPAPARILDEVARFDAEAEAAQWDGPRYRMTYRIKGEGPPLFVLPGIASTYQIYALFLNQLGARFRTIIYDYPGEHPDDGAKLKRITHEDLVDDLFGLIDHLNIGRAFLAGLSFGSTVVLEGPASRAQAVSQGRRARRVCPSPFLGSRAVGAGLGSPGPGNGQAASVSRDRS